jgi:DNA-directed RNA polymerase subunit RPC12/RpoP
MKRANSDGFTRVKLGEVKKIKGFDFSLSFKWQKDPLHTCRYCGSSKTFHAERMKDMEESFQKTGRIYENTISEERVLSANTFVLKKMDLCLSCGREFAIQVFCWEKIGTKGIVLFDFKTGEILIRND